MQFSTYFLVTLVFLTDKVTSPDLSSEIALKRWIHAKFRTEIQPSTSLISSVSSAKEMHRFEFFSGLNEGILPHPHL